MTPADEAKDIAQTALNQLLKDDEEMFPNLIASITSALEARDEKIKILREALEFLVKDVDNWHQAVSSIIEYDVERHEKNWPSLVAARKALDELENK
jgi:hypothetical protein